MFVANWPTRERSWKQKMEGRELHILLYLHNSDSLQRFVRLSLPSLIHIKRKLFASSEKNEFYCKFSVNFMYYPMNCTSNLAHTTVGLVYQGMCLNIIELVL